MNDVIIFGAKDLIFVMVVGYLATVLLLDRHADRLQVLSSAVIGLVAVLILLVILSHLHNDPRPFVQNSHLRPLISHAPDNGFPSDHSAVAGLIAGMVALRHRLSGLLFALAAGLVAAARVAAHVHHVQDVIAGLAIGAIAAYAGTYVAMRLFRHFGTRPASKHLSLSTPRR